MDYNVIERIEKVKALQIPDDLKKSQVGLIPKRWNIETLNSISLGPGKYGANASAVEYSEKLPTYLRITDIDENGRLRKNKLRSVNISDSENYKLKNGDLVFTRTGATTGKTYLYNVNDGELVYAGFLIKFSLDLKKVVPKFITAITKTDYYDSWVCVMSTRSGQPGINSKEYGELCLPIPPIEEQQKIAEILTTWDKAIELKEKLVEEKKKKKNGLMQRLFSQELRFKDDDGNEYPKWKEKKLGSMFKIVTGTTPSTKDNTYYGGLYPWITPSDIKEGQKYINNAERTLTEKGLKKGRFLNKGSLLITCIASIGKNVLLTKDGSCNQQINALLPNNNQSTNFFYYLIEFNKDLLLKYAGITATRILNKETFASLKFLIPVLIEQEKIANILSIADKEIELLTKELETLKVQKKGLMQLLLTGIVRVNNDNKQ